MFICGDDDTCAANVAEPDAVYGHVDFGDAGAAPGNGACGFDGGHKRTQRGSYDGGEEDLRGDGHNGVGAGPGRITDTTVS